MPSAPSIRIEYTASRWQQRLTWGLIGAAGLTLAIAPWPLWLRSVSIAVYAVLVVLVARRGHGTAWYAVAWSGNGAWTVAFDPEKDHPAVLREARVFGPLIALRLDVDVRRLRVLLWPDSASPDDLRRLRIRLGREVGNARNMPE